MNCLNDLTKKLQAKHERSGTCPTCKERIEIFIFTERVSCICPSCGYAASVPSKKINVELLDVENKIFLRTL